MAVAAGGRQAEMRDFVTSLFRESPDLSILTHAIVRKKYLDHVGQENLSKEEKEQLKRLVEEELVQMKVDEPPGKVDLVKDSFKSGDRKRSRCISDTSDEEIKNDQEQKRQRTGKKLEVSSDDKDSGIDSKKPPLHGGPKRPRKFLDSSDQGDSGAEDHSAESGNDEQSSKSKGKEPLQGARRERQRGSKSAKGQWNRGPQDRVGSESEEATNTGQSDSEEEVEEQRKVIKGNSLKQRNLKLRKKAGKELKATDPEGKEKNRKFSEQRGGKKKSEGGSGLSEVEKISGKKRIDWSDSEEEEKSLNSHKAQGKVEQGAQKGLKGNESEDASGSDFDKKSKLQKKMANSQCRRKSRSTEDSGSSSEDSASQSPMRKEGARRASGERRSQQAGNYSKHKRQPKEAGRKKLQREDLSRKEPEEEEKVTQRIQEPGRTTSEESESEADEQKGFREKEQEQDSTSSNGESQTKENQGRPRKGALISHPPESESDESEDGDEREIRMLEKKGRGISRSDSSQEEDKLKNRPAQRSQRKSVREKESGLDSEDSGSEFRGGGKSQSQQTRRTEKLKRRSTSKEKHGEESIKEEGSSSEEGEPTSSNQHHLGKDKKNHSGKNEEHPSIRRLKRYIRECGVWRNYKKLLAGCHSRSAQIEVLREELGSLGMKGTPSLAKCKALKQKREEEAEVASLDINNIIATEGRPKRRNVWSLYSQPQESPALPEELPVCRHTTDWSQLRGVISSDEESS